MPHTGHTRHRQGTQETQKTLTHTSLGHIRPQIGVIWPRYIYTNVFVELMSFNCITLEELLYHTNNT